VLSQRGDDGQLTLLIIGYVAIAAMLVVVAIDASKVFLARRALSSVADAAALTAAQSIDRAAVYRGASLGCDDALPVDPADASAAATASIADDADRLRPLVVVTAPPDTTVTAGTISVRIVGAVHVPFGRALSLLGSSYAGGVVPISVTSHARSALSVPGAC